MRYARLWLEYFVAPVSSVPRIALCVVLVVSLAAAWSILILLADTAQAPRWLSVRLIDWLQWVSHGIAGVFGVGLIAGERYNRTLLYHLTKPIPRPAYYLLRVSSRAVFSCLFAFGVFILLMVSQRVVTYVFFAGSAAPFAMHLLPRAGFAALSAANATASLACLAALTRTRLNHVAYWAAMYAVVRWVNSASITQGPPNAAAVFARDVIGVLLVGPNGQVLMESAYGDWYALRALGQVVAGLLGALFFGLHLFQRAELAEGSDWS